MNKDQFVKNLQEALGQLSVRSGAQKHSFLAEEIKHIDLTPSKNVKIGSLVTIKNIENETNGEKTIEKYFIFSEGVGMIIKNETEIVVVSPNSPVGSALLGKREGDYCEVKTPGGTRFFVISKVE